MDIGPVEMVMLTFPGERADPTVVQAIADVVDKGYVTVLDLVFVTRSSQGDVRVFDVDQDLDSLGLGALHPSPNALISEEDMDLVRDFMQPGTSTMMIVYEESWARNVAKAVVNAGGEVSLHLQLPRDTVEAAYAGATAQQVG
jgi:Family of unknown function (DUF6325)